MPKRRLGVTPQFCLSINPCKWCIVVSIPPPEQLCSCGWGMESPTLSGGSRSTCCRQCKRHSRKPGRRGQLLGMRESTKQKPPFGETEAAITTRGEEPAVTCVFQEVLE